MAESRKADHFAAISLVNEENLIKEENISTLKLHLDDNVNFTYANELIPRAIGYSAKLLDYFFRGRLEVVSVPVLWENSLVQLGLKIKNATPGENIGEGRFALVYRYTPEGGNPDDSNDILGQAWASQDSIYHPIKGLLSGKEDEFMFLIPQGAIPLQNLGSAWFTLTFRGELGNEDGAVIGKVFSPGEVKFNEEWDNGLLGNHTWAHNGLNGPDSNGPRIGESLNLVEGGVLIKENVRYAGRT
ncbi:MAG: hypothetical protein NTY64_16470 [Deltaproteobacteria bacterium]|nr:hypothetical protein [Deltaproteobacteria bacterium]